jgi:hypothetical protein
MILAAVSSLPAIGHSAANIGRTAAEFARHSRAPATESAYASDWADFSAWCNSAERIALPAEPVTIGAYLSDRSGILKVSTLNRRLAAITAMHRLGGHGLDNLRKLALTPPGQSNRTDKSRLLAVLGISESEYVTRFTSPAQTDWVMRCTPRKVLRTAEQEPIVLPPAKRAA